MTSRTHDLAAFTFLLAFFVWQPLHPMTLATVFVAVLANMLGGLAPDLDEPTAEIWQKIRGGSLWGKLFSPFLGGHRLISHSIIGFVIFGMAFNWLLQLSKPFLIVDQGVIWWAFMIGVLSHYGTDMMTKQGIPLFFPFHFHVGIPPFKALRIKTGGFLEKFVVFPGFIALNGYLAYTNYTKLVEFFHLVLP